jgi:hypothetical protein
LSAVLGDESFQHPLGRLRCGGEPDLALVIDAGDPGLGAPLLVVGPGLRQRELPVDQGPPARRCVGEEHATWAVLDPPSRAGALTLHAGGLGALLQQPGLVGDQTRRITEMVQHIAAQIITDSVRVPAVDAQQPLHPLRAQITRLLGDGPRVLPLRTREQSQHIQPASTPRVGLREPPSHQREHLIKPGLPAGQAIIDYCPRRGHRVLFKIQHTLKSTTRWPSP